MKPLEMIKKQRELFVLFDQYQESADQAQRTVLLDKADVLMFSLTGRGHGVAANDTPDVTATAGTYEDVLSALSLTNSAIAKSIRSNLDHIKGIEEKDPNLAGYSVDYFKGEIQDTLNGHAEDQAVVDLILLAVHAFQVETGITVFTPRQQVWNKRSPKLGLDPKSKAIPPLPASFNQVPALGADAPNKNIVLGFDGINGITQPTTNAGGRIETVYTNKRNNTTLGIELSKINGLLNPDDVIVNGGETLAKIKHRKANKKNLFDQVASKADIERLEKAAKLVADYVNSVFPLTYKGLTIRADGGDEFYHVSSDTGTYADFPLSKIIADIDSGEAEKKTNLSLDERLALLDEHKIAPATHNEDPMLEQFREGAFNDQSVDDFKATMLKVADLGMPIDEVKSGVYAWAEVDERSRLVA